MDKGVEETEKGAVAAWKKVFLVIFAILSKSTHGELLTGCKFNSKPDTHGHNAMVDNVEGGDVAILFSQDEKELQNISISWSQNLQIFYHSFAHRIKKLCKLAKIVPPAHMHHSQCHWRMTIVNRLAVVVVPVEPAAATVFVKLIKQISKLFKILFY